MTASASAVTLRGIPQCHGENVEQTARPRSASGSGTVELLSVTSSCTASGPRRSDSIAERESVAAGTRVGDWDAAARRGAENCLWPCSAAEHSARQEHARLPAAERRGLTGSAAVRGVKWRHSGPRRMLSEGRRAVHRQHSCQRLTRR
ncbi:hypothetical protein TcYC6_0038040 [Trypanosoma cruzi]|nr:hypothetical protein TcYC6_0038040 [Trypanosoma cruzi]